MTPRKIVVMGAAGRDFHNFNCLFRHDPRYDVVAFTATQIPNIDGRTYPPVLSGPRYPEGIPIVPEEELGSLITGKGVEEAWFSYSDVSHQYVMEQASRVSAAGAHFVLFSAIGTMLESSRPVVAVTAVRTGAGKSQTTRYLSRIFKKLGKRVVAVRHPMPYGDLSRQVCQRFATYEDLDRHECTIEEREEYEPHIDNGFVVYAGVDYQKILAEAEKEADVILWDGGNNDSAFFQADLYITIVDPHRRGDEIAYYPGAVNLLLADVIIINKVRTAQPEWVEEVKTNCRRLNPEARIVECASTIQIDGPEAIAGKRALVVEDGPTLTHGGMSYGAGWLAAREAEAAEIVDARPYAVGTIQDTYEKYPNAARILPAMGYGAEQIRELEETINATPADIVVEGTPIDLRRIIEVNKPIANVTYELEEIEDGVLESMVTDILKGDR